MNRSSKIGPVQQPHLFTKKMNIALHMNYLLYLPEGYSNNDRKMPLLLFLHGAGERGDDLELVKTHGPAKLIEKGRDFPFIVVSPQCPKDQWWPDLMPILSLKALLDEIIENYRVDEDRIYLTGLSMGGFGTWQLAMDNPERFAAIAPICGGGQPFLAGRLKEIPIWAFHGAKDPVVPLDKSVEMVEAVKKAGGQVSFTVYPEAGHDSWTATYDNPDLYTWFLKHRRQRSQSEF